MDLDTVIWYVTDLIEKNTPLCHIMTPYNSDVVLNHNKFVFMRPSGVHCKGTPPMNTLK